MARIAIDDAVRLARGHHLAGRLNDAEPIYRQVLAAAPNHADALHLLGVLRGQLGECQEGLELIRRAIALAPNVPTFHANLGKLFRQLGQLDEAAASYQRSIQFAPTSPQAHFNLGNVWNEKKQWDQAIASYQRALELDPKLVEAHFNLGNIWLDKSCPDQAMVCFRRALDLKPGYAQAHHGLGNACSAKGQLAEAITSYRHALALKPDYDKAYNNLANALLARGHFDQAIEAYQQALKVTPDKAELHSNLGNAWGGKWQYDQAIACYQRALELNPNCTEAANNLGVAWRETGRLDQAIASFRRVLQLKPDHLAARDNLLFTLPCHPDSDRRSLFEETGRWNQIHGAAAQRTLHHANTCDATRPLRVGYVSPDYRSHPVGRFILPLLQHHDRANFDIFCYAQVAQPDTTTQRLQALAGTWRSIVGLSDQQVVDLIRQDGIDILVDLAMHTAGNRLGIFARKPAPVQVTYLAYAGGTGVEAIDYRLTDRYLDPDESEDRFYLEKSLRLKSTYWCYEQTFFTPPVNLLPAGQNGPVTFVCLNNFCKINDGVLETWSQLLQQVADSRLLLYCPEGNHRNELRQFFTRRGIDSSRLQLAGRLSAEDYFKLYLSTDIALDPFPYTGGTTTCDALWMGAPVVTLAGRTAVGRSGVSLLSTLGHPEWIAQSLEDYLRIASGLASDRPRLSAIRQLLRGQMRASPLMDAPRFTRDIESAYRTMWQAWCSNP